MMRRARRMACVGLLVAAALAATGQSATAAARRKSPVVVAPLVVEPPPVVEIPAITTPPAVLEKDFAKELGSGTLITTVENRRKAKTAYVPPEATLRPYAAASVGAAVASELASGTEFANAPAAQALCQDIVDRLLTGWAGAKPDVKVRILASPFYHGAAVPSGLMLVGLGTFNADQAKGAIGVDELALLLGHELGHVLLGHLDNQKMMTTVARGVALLGNSYLVYAQVEKSRMVGDQFTMIGDKQSYRQGLIGTLATQTLINDLLKPSFGRNKELEADRIGIDLAVRAGFKISRTTADQFVHHHSNDHDLLTARMEALGVVLHALSAEASTRFARKMGSFGNLGQKVSAIVTDEAIKATLNYIAKRNKDHPDVDQRSAFLQRYVIANYPEAPPVVGQRPRKDTRLSTVATSPLVTQLLGHVAEAQEVNDGVLAAAAEKDVGKGDVAFNDMLKKAGLTQPPAPAPAAKARKGKPVRTVVAAAPRAPTGFVDDNADFTARMQGILLEANGAADGARVAWHRGIDTALPSLDTARRWTRSLTLDQRAAQLPPVIDRYRALLGTADPIVDLGVAAAVARGDIATAETTAAKCLTYENGQFYPSCVGFLGYDPTNKETPATTVAGRSAFGSRSLEKSFQWTKTLTDIF